MKPVISFFEADRDGYELLSGPFKLPSERGLLDKGIADMERGKIDYALVGTSNKINIARKGMTRINTAVFQ